MPFPDTTTLIDDFNRTNGAVNAGAGSAIWTANRLDGGAAAVNVASNQMAAAAAGGNVRSAVSYGPDLDLQFDFPVLCGTNGQYVAVWWGVQNPGATYTSYCLLLSRAAAASYQWQFRKYVSAVRTTIATPSSAMVAGDRIGVRQIGATVEFYRYTAGAWAQIMSTPDASIPPGRGPVAFEFGDTVARLDNLSGGDLVASAVNPIEMLV